MARFRIPSFATGSHSQYQEVLQDSFLSVALPGAGHETARRWEDVGACAALASPELPLRMPHPLRHYVDPVKALLEWKGVLKIGAALAIIVPDERARDAVCLDLTHTHCITIPRRFFLPAAVREVRG